MPSRLFMAIALSLAVPTFAASQDVDIPAVDAIKPVVVAPVEAKTYDKQYPILLVYRYVQDADEYRPMLQRLTLAPARIETDGGIDVLLDPATHTQFDDVDMRTERGRSPVFRAMMDDFVSVMGLMAKERYLRQAIETAKADDPKANTDDLAAKLKTLQAALGITP